MAEIKSQKDLAKVLTALTFGELMSISDTLVKMNEDDNGRDVSTAQGMAQTLHDWAFSVVEDL